MSTPHEEVQANGPGESARPWFMSSTLHEELEALIVTRRRRRRRLATGALGSGLMLVLVLVAVPAAQQQAREQEQTRQELAHLKAQLAELTQSQKDRERAWHAQLAASEQAQAQQRQQLLELTRSMEDQKRTPREQLVARSESQETLERKNQELARLMKQQEQLALALSEQQTATSEAREAVDRERERSSKLEQELLAAEKRLVDYQKSERAVELRADTAPAVRYKTQVEPKPIASYSYDSPSMLEPSTSYSYDAQSRLESVEPAPITEESRLPQHTENAFLQVEAKRQTSRVKILSSMEVLENQQWGAETVLLKPGAHIRVKSGATLVLQGDLLRIGKGAVLEGAPSARIIILSRKLEGDLVCKVAGGSCEIEPGP